MINKDKIPIDNSKKDLFNTVFKLELKALSVNKCWQGRRFKTPDYNKYEQDVSFLLPKNIIITGEIGMLIEYHCKNYKMIDLDNLCKPLLDILVKNGIIEDDRKIVKLNLRKIKSDLNDYLIISIWKI